MCSPAAVPVATAAAVRVASLLGRNLPRRPFKDQSLEPRESRVHRALTMALVRLIGTLGKVRPKFVVSQQYSRCDNATTSPPRSQSRSSPSPHSGPGAWRDDLSSAVGASSLRRDQRGLIVSRLSATEHGDHNPVKPDKTLNATESAVAANTSSVRYDRAAHSLARPAGRPGRPDR